MLSTIEANIDFLNSKRGKKCIENLLENIKALGIPFVNDDPTKILLKGGYNLSKTLFEKYNIEDERVNDKTVLLVCGIGTTKQKLYKLKKALKDTVV
jgi:hypothetical protein